METRAIIHVLQESKFFNHFSMKDLDRIAPLCRVVTYAPGEPVFRQGDTGEELYIVASGQVDLERMMNLGAHKGRVLIESLGTGRLLGCWSTLMGEGHILMSSAICRMSTRLVIIPGKALRRLMTGNSDFGFAVMERLCFLMRDRIEAAYGALDKI